MQNHREHHIKPQMLCQGGRTRATLRRIYEPKKMQKVVSKKAPVSPTPKRTTSPLGKHQHFEQLVVSIFRILLDYFTWHFLIL